MPNNTQDAPSVSGVELPAVMVGLAFFLPNTGFNDANFSNEISGRRLLSRVKPLNGVIKSSKKPSSYARAKFLWLLKVNSSCASRVIAHSSAVMAWWSPIDNLVRGSPFCGASIKSFGLMLNNACKRSLLVLALLSFNSALRSPSPMPKGASEVVSTPPAIPESISPKAILLLTAKAACSPVPHACDTS